MGAMKIVATDIETGQTEEITAPDDNYLILTTGSAYVDGIQTYQKTHVITIKGLTNGIPRLAPTAPGSAGE